ncbi:MAG: PaaI family thioesterase [Alphaproteobacteria bacterium]
MAGDRARPPLVPANPDFAARVRAEFAGQGFMAFIGAELTLIEPGLCEIRLPHRAQLTQQHGLFHGGLVGTLADNAAGFAACSLMPANTGVLTVEFKLNLLRPGDGDALRARGEVVRAGRTLTVCRSDVFVERAGDDVLCATALVTIMGLAERPDGPR